MHSHVLLNNLEHQDLRVQHRFAAAFGDNQPAVAVYPSEFLQLQKEYAILFRQQDGQFYSTVLLGFAAGENLYLNDQLPSGWDARQLPASIEKGPFLIGFQRQPGQAEPTPVIHVDPAHPKVSTQRGQPLFLPEGGHSPYLEHMIDLLQRLHLGHQSQPAFFAAIEPLGLLRPISIEFSLDNGEKHRLLGNYCIDQQRLAQLSGAELERLNQSGALALLFAQVSSMSNIQTLIERKNALSKGSLATRVAG
ncbi:SapC family protein [Rheinheimera sp.]|uniref:SapC family protein n=1 Tax=Rheinheimera sp. TaxID=1869214 RepID=UPI003AF95398